MPIQLSTHEAGPGVAVLAVGGDVDHYTAPQLRESIESILAAAPQRLVVDLTDTDFLDSSAFGALVGAQRLARSAAATLAVACPKTHLRRLFEIARLDQVIPVHPDLASALA